MAAPVYSRIFSQDITQKVETRHGGGLVFNGNINSMNLGVRLFNDGEPLEISGTVTGQVIKSDGSTALTENGTIAGNLVSVTLNQSCFAVEGPIVASISVTDDGVKTTVLRAAFTVALTSSGPVIDPGQVVPDVEDIVAQYGEMQRVTAEAQAAAGTALSAAADSIGLKSSLTTAVSVSGTQIEISDALPMPPDSITVEIEASQSGTPTPSSPVDVVGISAITFTRTDGDGQNANTIDVDLTEATGGTVYGGTLTLNANGTGTLTLTWAKKTLAKIDEDGGGFGYYTSGAHPLFRISMAGRKIGTNVKGFCNTYDFDRSASLGSLSTNVPDKCFGYQSTQLYIVFRDDDYRESDYDSRADMIAAWLAANTNTYVVYELDAPIEIQVAFTPVSLYDGGNILTNDAGLSMALIYRKDKYYTAEDAEYSLGSLNGWALTVGAPEQVRGKRYVLKSEWVFPPTGSSDPPMLYTRWDEES